MRPFILSVFASAACIHVACRDRSASPPAEAIVTSVATRKGEAEPTCPALGDLRLSADTIGRLATHQTVGALRGLCPAARSDDAGVGGEISPALRFTVPGGSLWAIQTAYGYRDSLRSAEPADLWAATGDSLRFPDGTLIPMRVGALRALDSVAVIVVQYGDDSGGSYIVRCKYPSLEIVIGNDWPSFADSGVVPLSRASARDTTSVWRVLIELGRVDAVVTRACAQAQAT